MLGRLSILTVPRCNRFQRTSLYLIAWRRTMTSQPIPSPHQLPAGFLYCADLDCAYCKEQRAARFRNPAELFLVPKSSPAQLFLVPKSTYAISRTRELTLLDLTCCTCYSIEALSLAVMGIVYVT